MKKARFRERRGYFFGFSENPLRKYGDRHEAWKEANGEAEMKYRNFIEARRKSWEIHQDVAMVRSEWGEELEGGRKVCIILVEWAERRRRGRQ